MKSTKLRPSLLIIAVFAGTGCSKSYEGIFEELFGNEVESNEEQNSVSLKDEDHRTRYEVLNSDNSTRYGEDNSTFSQDEERHEGEYTDEENDDEENSIPYLNENRYKTKYWEGEIIDNRVGYIYHPKHDARTEESYQELMKELAEWIYNFSHQPDLYAAGRETGLLNFDVTHEELR